MSDRFFRLTGALREAPAALGALPGAARRTRAGLTTRTAVARSIKQCLGALALMALAAASVSGGSASAATQRISGTNAERQAAMAHAPERGTHAAERGTGPGPASAAIPRIAKTRAQWKAGIARLRQPRAGTGCYRAAYPVLRWHAARCVKAPRVPLTPRPLPRPRPARHAGPDQIGGGGTDYSAQSPSRIFQATGTFTDVSPGIYEQGLAYESGSPEANAFTLQLNTQFFTGSPACSGSSDPSNCQAWQQFVYSYADSTTGLLYMQYWLINYDATCPAGWIPSNSDCYMNSNAAPVDTLTASQLATVSLTGTAALHHNDSVSMAVGSGQATLVTASDSVLDLGAFWSTTQWGVYGDGDGSEAYFSPGTTLQAQTALVTATPAAPTCVQEDFTGESNNLSLTSTPALSGGLSPTMASAQTNGTTGTPSCSTTAGANPAVVGVLIGGVAWVKEGGLSAGWVDEYSGVSQIAVASDPANGPLIAVLTTGGVVYAKEGGLSAGWVEEATGIKQIAVASDPANGPLIAVLTAGGVAWVKEGGLSAPWVDEASGISQIAVASDAANGPLIGVLAAGGVADAKEGSLSAGWVFQDSGISQIAVASDAFNGPLIGVLTTGGDALAKEGGLYAGFVNEYNGVAQIAVASDASEGLLIGVTTTATSTDCCSYVKQGGLSTQWIQVPTGWLALSSDADFGPLISTLTFGGVAYSEVGLLTNSWVEEETGVSQVVSAG